MRSLLSPIHFASSTKEIESSALSEAFLNQWNEGSISIASFLVTEIGMGPERLQSLVFSNKHDKKTMKRVWEH